MWSILGLVSRRVTRPAQPSAELDAATGPCSGRRPARHSLHKLSRDRASRVIARMVCVIDREQHGIATSPGSRLAQGDSHGRTSTAWPDRHGEDGKLTRRVVRAQMIALGLTAPMATQVLTCSGVPAAAAAEGKFHYKPTKRGGGGALKVLWWQGPTLLNPHFATGTKDRTARASSTNRSRGWDQDGDLVPILAAEVPSDENGGAGADGKSVIWKLKRGVQWHDGKPFTADDVVFNWEFAADPASACDHVRDLQGHQGREGRRLHRDGDVRSADAVLGGSVRRYARHDDSRSTCSRTIRREVTRCAGQPEAGGHRTLQVRRLQAGRRGPRRDQSQTITSRTVRISTRFEMKGGGDAVSAARAVLQTGEYDFAWNMQVEDEILLRLEKGGKGRALITVGRQHRTHPAEHHRSVDRGRR